MPGCPSDDALLDFAAGRLGGPAAEAILEHLDGCARCRAAMDAALLEDAAPASAGAETEVPLDQRRGRRARTFRRAAAVGAALVAMGAGGFAASRAVEGVNACRQVPDELAGVWDKARRGSLQAAFARTGAPYAAGAWEAVERSLDAYSGAWAQLGTAACEASRKDASSELARLERACLQRRRVELRSLVDVLGEADAEVVASSVEAVSALTPIARCAGDGSPRAPAKVEALRERLARVKALSDVGRSPAALPMAEAAVEEARSLDDLPVLAEALIRQGKLQLETGAAKDAVPAYESAELAAEESRDERGAAEAAVGLVQALTVLGRLPEGRQWQRRAEAYLRRLGRDDDLQAALLVASARLSKESGHPEDAVEGYRQAAAVRERQFGPDHPLFARALQGEAAALESLGQPARALEIAERVAAIQQKALGPDHPLALSAGCVRGSLLQELGRSAEAVEVLRQVLARQRAALGPDSPLLGPALLALGQAYTGLGQAKAATEVLEELLRRLQADPASPRAEIARAQFALAQAAWQGGDRARGRALAEQAKQALAGETCCSKLRADVPAWLDARR